VPQSRPTGLPHLSSTGDVSMSGMNTFGPASASGYSSFLSHRDAPPIPGSFGFSSAALAAGSPTDIAMGEEGLSNAFMGLTTSNAAHSTGLHYAGLSTGGITGLARPPSPMQTPELLRRTLSQNRAASGGGMTTGHGMAAGLQPASAPATRRPPVLPVERLAQLVAAAAPTPSSAIPASYGSSFHLAPSQPPPPSHGILAAGAAAGWLPLPGAPAADALRLPLASATASMPPSPNLSTSGMSLTERLSDRTGSNYDSAQSSRFGFQTQAVGATASVSSAGVAVSARNNFDPLHLLGASPDAGYRSLHGGGYSLRH
jgi:hypothetical protein